MTMTKRIKMTSIFLFFFWYCSACKENGNNIYNLYYLKLYCFILFEDVKPFSVRHKNIYIMKGINIFKAP